MQRMMPLPDDCAVFEIVNKLPQRQEHVIKGKVKRLSHRSGSVEKQFGNNSGKRIASPRLYPS